MKILFHGSSRPDLKYLKPSRHISFATPSFALAVAFSASPWSDRELDFGRIGNGPWTFKEKIPGAFKLLDKRGYIYVLLKPEHYHPRKRGNGLGPYEWTSKKGSPLLKVAEIKNVCQALVSFGVRLKSK
jgi:hypothetical protein